MIPAKRKLDIIGITDFRPHPDIDGWIKRAEMLDP